VLDRLGIFLQQLLDPCIVKVPDGQPILLDRYLEDLVNGDRQERVLIAERLPGIARQRQIDETVIAELYQRPSQFQVPRAISLPVRITFARLFRIEYNVVQVSLTLRYADAQRIIALTLLHPVPHHRGLEDGGLGCRQRVERWHRAPAAEDQYERHQHRYPGSSRDVHVAPP
jgi:hypothetical protein